MSDDAFFVSGAADVRGKQFRWPVDGLAFGGDYSPEQWSEETWREDVALMRAAGVTIVSLGIFSWGQLEVADGVYEFGWLDRIMDLLHENGISVNLATPTAAPPMWLFREHPEIASVDERGVRTSPGGRLGWSASSAVFRTYALRIVRVIAERYATHPALRMWHVSNELGNENSYCYSDETEQAFGRWLRARYTTIDALNEGWGTAFWGHRYGGFDEVPVPRFARTSHNPGLVLDFKRFSSDALLEHFIAERDVVRSITPDVPLSTNFMIHAGGGAVDYARWADEVDLVTNDHYAIAADSRRREELAFSADRTRGAARGRPWLLLEHAPGSVNWQSRNRAKLPGELARDSLSHVAAGSDGAMFFQWRQSVAGGEQFHSGMVPHAGQDSRVHREVRELGASLGRLAEIRGSRVTGSTAAILWDQDAAWAFDSGRKPSDAIDYDELAVAIHAELVARGVGIDVISASMPLTEYTLVVVPNHYLLEPSAVMALEEFVRAGGHVLVTYLSGIVDSTNRVIPGGYPGALRELVGIRVEEFHPLLEGETVSLDSGAVATDWAEHVRLAGATAIDSYATGPLAGLPAVTLNRLGEGTASYLSAHIDRAAIGALVEATLARTSTSFRAPNGIETARRSSETSSWLFAFNHGEVDRELDARGVDLIAGAPFGGTLAAGGIAVIRETQPPGVRVSRALRWGILGTGGIANEFATDLLLTGHVVAAVGSRSQAGADEFADRHGIPHSHPSYEALAADPDVDIVYVATPHSLHAGNALLALEAGKHVLVEKPFSINAREAREVADAASERGLMAMEAMWTRFLPHMVRIREIIAAGTIGEVRTLIAGHDHRQTSDLTHRVHDPALGGGALLEVGIYPVSFAWDILGQPSEVRALGSMSPTGVDGQTAILLGYPGGQQAMLHASAEAIGGSTASILGTEGRIEIDATWFTPASFTVFNNARDVVERFEQGVVGRGLHLQATALERAIASGRATVPELPIDESVAIMATLDEIRADIGLRYPSD